jgi:hypothetical protein
MEGCCSKSTLGLGVGGLGVRIYTSHKSETVSKCAILGRSQDVCKGSLFYVEGKGCVVSNRPLFKRLEVKEEEKGVYMYVRRELSTRGCMNPQSKGDM